MVDGSAGGVEFDGALGLVDGSGLVDGAVDGVALGSGAVVVVLAGSVGAGASVDGVFLGCLGEEFWAIAMLDAPRAAMAMMVLIRI